jgi:hypothetical protein
MKLRNAAFLALTVLLGLVVLRQDLLVDETPERPLQRESSSETRNFGSGEPSSTPLEEPPALDSVHVEVLRTQPAPVEPTGPRTSVVANPGENRRLVLPVELPDFTGAVWVRSFASGQQRERYSQHQFDGQPLRVEVLPGQERIWLWASVDAVKFVGSAPLTPIDSADPVEVKMLAEPVLRVRIHAAGKFAPGVTPWFSADIGVLSRDGLSTKWSRAIPEASITTSAGYEVSFGLSDVATKQRPATFRLRFEGHEQELSIDPSAVAPGKTLYWDVYTAAEDPDASLSQLHVQVRDSFGHPLSTEEFSRVQLAVAVGTVGGTQHSLGPHQVRPDAESSTMVVDLRKGQAGTLSVRHAGDFAKPRAQYFRATQDSQEIEIRLLDGARVLCSLEGVPADVLGALSLQLLAAGDDTESTEVSLGTLTPGDVVDLGIVPTGQYRWRLGLPNYGCWWSEGRFQVADADAQVDVRCEEPLKFASYSQLLDLLEECDGPLVLRSPDFESIVIPLVETAVLVPERGTWQVGCPSSDGRVVPLVLNDTWE